MNDPMESAYIGEDFLSHYGVKGMHWGIRNDYKNGRLNWKRNLKLTEIANKGFRKDLRKLNNDVRFRNQDVSSRKTPLGRQYDQAARDLFQTRLDALNRRIPTSRDGQSQFQYHVEPHGNVPTTWVVRDTVVSTQTQHSESEPLSDIVAYVSLELDSLGHIVTTTISSELAMDVFDLGEDFLSHYGVKGMHWGIRKDKSDVDISGLSNEELKKTVERMRLERQYSELARDSRVSSGAKFAAKHANQAASIVVGAITSTVVGIAINRVFHK